MRLAEYGPDFLSGEDLQDSVGIRMDDRVQQYMSGQYDIFGALDRGWEDVLRIDARGRSLDFYAELVDYLKQCRPKGLILDIGCATGRLEEDLGALADAAVIGLDNNAPYLVAAHARVKAQNVRFVRADAARLPIIDEAIDMTLLVNVLDRVSDPTRVLAECRRVTRPRGTVVVALTHDWGYSPNPLSPSDVARLLDGQGFRPARADPTELVWVLPDALNGRHLHLYRVHVAPFQRR